MTQRRSTIGFRHSTTALLLTLLLSATAERALAQTPGGVLTGTIRDSQGGVLPGATVVAVQEPSGVRSQTLTRGDGRYSLAVPRPGTYRITASLTGFRDAEATMTLGSEQARDFVLELPDIREELTVRAATALAHGQKRAAASIMDAVSADAAPPAATRAMPSPSQIEALQIRRMQFSPSIENSADKFDLGSDEMSITPGRVLIVFSRGTVRGVRNA